MIANEDVLRAVLMLSETAMRVYFVCYLKLPHTEFHKITLDCLEEWLRRPEEVRDPDSTSRSSRSQGPSRDALVSARDQLEELGFLIAETPKPQRKKGQQTRFKVVKSTPSSEEIGEVATLLMKVAVRDVVRDLLREGEHTSPMKK